MALDPLANKVLPKRDAKMARFLAATPEQIHEDCKKRMAYVDALPYEWRLLVHEFGLAKVRRVRDQTRGNLSKARAILFPINLEEFGL